MIKITNDKTNLIKVGSIVRLYVAPNPFVIITFLENNDSFNRIFQYKKFNRGSVGRISAISEFNTQTDKEKYCYLVTKEDLKGYNIDSIKAMLSCHYDSDDFKLAQEILKQLENESQN